MGIHLSKNLIAITAAFDFIVIDYLYIIIDRIKFI